MTQSENQVLWDVLNTINSMSPIKDREIVREKLLSLIHGVNPNRKDKTVVE